MTDLLDKDDWGKIIVSSLFSIGNTTSTDSNFLSISCWSRNMNPTWNPVINVEKNKDKKIILWEVNSFPAIEIKSGKDHEEDV